MWLLLCGAHDLPALWAARGLESRGLKPLEVITDEALAYNRRFVHRISTEQPFVNIELSDGREIRNSDICGTLNRLQLIPSQHLRGADVADRYYAEQELYALFLSWIYGLPGPILNRPTPQGLSGAWRHLSEWILLVAQAGLPHLPYCQNDMKPAPKLHILPNSIMHSIVVVNNTCFGPAAPQYVLEGCVCLAQLCKTNILGVDFQITHDGTWIFVNATPNPDLRLGGELLLDELLKALKL